MTPRLSIITPVYPPARGGIERLTEGIATRWPGPVEVVTLKEPNSDSWDRAAGYPIHRALNKPRGGRRAVMALTMLATARAVAFRPDIVLSMHVRCAQAARISRSLVGARWVQYFHAKEIPTWRSSSELCVRAADHGIAVSRYTASLVETVGALRGGVSIIPPAVESHPTPPRRPHPRPTILTVSRLHDAYKGHDLMLAALPSVRAAVPDVRWVVVGDGRLLPGLRRAAAQADLLDMIEFVGAVTDQERDQLLSCSHVFALPSRVDPDGCSGEGFGIVYVEAAAAGLPVVAGNQGGVVDAVRHGINGLLIDPTDPADLARALITVLSDESLAQRLGAAGRQWSGRFSWNEVMPELQNAIIGSTVAVLPDPDPANIEGV